MPESHLSTMIRELSTMGDDVANAAALRMVNDLKGVSPVICLVALMRSAGSYVDFYLSSGEENQEEIERALMEVLRDAISQGVRFDG